MAGKNTDTGATEAPTGTMSDATFDTVFAALSDGKSVDELLADPPKEAPPKEEPPKEEPPKEETPKEAPLPDAAKLAEEAAQKAAKDAEAAAAKAQEEAERKAAEEAAKVKAEADKAAADSDSAKAGEILAEVAKDFPEVGQALEIIKKQALAEAKAMFSEELAELKKSLAPVVSTVQSSAQSTHEQAILSKHPDAFDLVGEADAWIEKQPAFLQPGYKQVLDKGTASEIVQFFDLFKAATGKTASAGDAAAKAKADAEEAERKAKLESQEGVKSRQTQRKETLDPNDFDGAFEKFAESA